jgi:hypothetical protein
MSNRRRFTLLDAIDDPQLFQPWFKDPSSWSAWFVFLRALFGLPLAPHQLALYRECTGRTDPPIEPASEGWLVCGRRSGKSFMLALVAVYLAAFHTYRQYLQAGERGTIMVIACDRRQARTIFRYIGGLLTKVPMLARMVERQTAECFDLHNDVTIEVAVASFRSVRGYTVVACLCDELAFWPTDESANPDTEIIAAIRPAMATIPNSMLLCASSPYAQRGALFDAFKRHYGKDIRSPNTFSDPVLVWRAPTRTMNPTVPQSVIDAALEADPASAAAEYMAQFRTDVETFVTRDVVEAAVIQGRFELPRVEHVRYWAFVDPSGGSSDSMTLAICHMASRVRGHHSPTELSNRDHGPGSTTELPGCARGHNPATEPLNRDRGPGSTNHVIIDAIRERRAPFSPDDVVKEFSDTLRSYGVARVVGDRYAAEWPRERFKVHGIEYRVADKTKSDLYLSLLPLLNSGRIELLDHPRLLNQLAGLERRTSRAGKDSIDHVPGGHDDIANAVAGAAVLVAQAAAHPQVRPVVGAVFSNGEWWDAPPVNGQRPLTTTEAFFQSGYGGGSRWPGSDPFARDW